MEAAAVLPSPLSISTPHNSVLRPSISARNSASFARFRTNFPLSKSVSSSHVNLGFGKLTFQSRRCSVVRASASSDSAEPTAPIAPLQFESPVGQFLSQMLAMHPHLVPAAAERQLEQLQTDFESEKQREESSASGTDLVLYRRIAEVKGNERRRALEEILYTLVVQKFMDADISLIPSISPSSSDPVGRVDTWPSQDEKLQEVHSPEAYEMIQNHLALILGNRLNDSSTVAQISKLRVGQVYAGSVMYGYFLKRVDERFQLEKAMKILPEQMGEREKEIVDQGKIDDVISSTSDDSISYRNAQSHPEVSSWAGGISPEGFGHGIKSSRLRSYVMSFDADMLSRYPRIRSKATVTIIEKHAEALFGKPEIVITPQGTIDPSKDEQIRIGFSGIKRLVLEAVTFGSFLWEVESYVDSRYNLLLN